MASEAIDAYELSVAWAFPLLPPFHSALGRSGWINWPLRLGATGGLRKLHMHSDSLKAQHNSFAHHRAHLLFAKPPSAKNSDITAPRRQNDKTPELAGALRSRVRASLLGVASAVQVAL